MPCERFFITSPLEPHQEVILDGPEFHHLVHVMRLQEGEQVELVNGQGILANATLHHRDKKKALLTVESIFQEEKPVRECILAQALPRINRLDFIIEKSTELGVTQIWLFPGQLSERKTLTDHQIERLQSMTIAAMKQCGRLYLPKLELKPSLDRWQKQDIASYFGDVRPSAPSFSQLHDKNDSSLFFIGPESGFTENEVQQLIQIGAQGVKLHSHILRTDTAALVALTLMNAIGT